VTRIIPIVVVLAFAACSRSAPAAASSEPQAPAAATSEAQTSTPPQGDLGGATSAEQAPPAPVKPVAAELPDVIARVNGEAISRGELEMAVSEIEARAGQPMPADQRDRVLRAVLDQLIGFRLLAQESVARKATVAEAELEKRLDQIRSQFPSDEVFQQQLKQRQLTLEKLRADTRANMQITAMLEAELGTRTAVSAEQVNDFYVKNPAAFQQGERVKASHILVRVQANADAAEREKALAKATAILADVKAGKDFAALAKEHSEDPGSGGNGGDLGYFQRGQMVPPFEQAAFVLAVGQTSELVTSDFGFHIIRVTDKQPGRVQPLTEVRADIEQYLLGQNREQQTRLFVDSLKAKGTVEIYI
jgi:peptidyl-prolyl cis-trans isomerase C